MRRLGSLAVVLVSNLSLVATPALAGPPADAHSLEQSQPVEGPSPPRPPSEPTLEPTLEPPPPGIEFAPQPPELEPTPKTSLPPPTRPRSLREEIGKAPSNGGAFLAGGAWLVPLAVVGTVSLVLANRSWQYPPYPSEPGIITAGVGLGVIGASMLGMGIYRVVALSRWAKRHRVVTLAQGSGLLTSGTMALLIGVGVLVPAIRNQDGVSGAIAGALLVSSPIQIAVGSHFARRYARTGGWRATPYTLSPGGLRIQF